MMMLSCPVLFQLVLLVLFLVRLLVGSFACWIVVVCVFVSRTTTTAKKKKKRVVDPGTFTIVQIALGKLARVKNLIFRYGGTQEKNAVCDFHVPM
jgi:hypothetical protein